MRLARLSALASALLFGMAACSLTSLDGFSVSSGIDDAGTGADGAPPASDADAEVPGPDDAGSDGPNGSPDGGNEASFCAALSPKPLFCSDFDTGLLPQPWNAVVASGGGAVYIDGAAHVSAPGALVASVPAGATGACVQRTFSGNFRTMRLELDVRADTLGPGRFDFVGIGRDDDNVITLQSTDLGDVEFDEDHLVGGQVVETVTPTPARVDATWKHLRWTIAISGGSATSSLELGGAVASFTGRSDIFSGEVTLSVGECSIGAKPNAWAFRFDNVVFDAE